MAAPPSDAPALNPGDRPSRLDLARHATGENTLAGPVDAVWLRELEAERARLEPFDWEILRARAARLPDEALAPAPAPARASWFAPLLALLVAAAAALAIVPQAVGPAPEEDGLKGPPSSGGGISAPRGRSGPEAIAPADLSATGAPLLGAVGTLGYVVQRGERRLRGTRSLVLEAGDLVSFRCYSARYREVTLVTVDVDGTVAPLDPDVGLAPVPLEPGQRVPLDAHFVVAPPIPPVVLAFFGEWTVDRIHATVKEATTDAGIDGLTELDDAADDVALVTLRAG